MGGGKPPKWYDELLTSAQQEYEQYIDRTVIAIEAARNKLQEQLTTTPATSAEHKEAGDALDELERIEIRLRGQLDTSKALYNRRLGPLTGGINIWVRKN